MADDDCRTPRNQLPAFDGSQHTSLWAALWAAEAAVNPIYCLDQWPRCPECGEPLVMRYKPPAQEYSNPEPMAVEWCIVHCEACGWARVRSRNDPPEPVEPPEEIRCAWCGEPMTPTEMDDQGYVMCRSCRRWHFVRVVHRRPIFVLYRASEAEVDAAAKEGPPQ